MNNSKKEGDFIKRFAFVMIFTGMAFVVAAFISRGIWSGIFDGLYPPGIIPAGRELAVQNAVNLIMYVMPTGFCCLGLGLLAVGGILFLAGTVFCRRFKPDAQEQPGTSEGTHHE